jgi:hypothetical protein
MFVLTIINRVNLDEKGSIKNTQKFWDLDQIQKCSTEICLFSFSFF